MENFQLYRTNLSLSGQLKWDLVIENANNHLYINKFNLTPISDNIAYTYKTDDTILNHTHFDNLKSYYKKLEGHFYAEGLDSQFSNNWPTIVSENEHINAYSSIYDMGCKRMKHYKKYNKQFEFFCPVWIERIKESLMFKITVKGNNSNAVLATHSLIVTDYADRPVHDKFVRYFKQYAQISQIHSGNDNIVKIDFDGNSYVAGISAKTGLPMVKNISSVVHNMTTRERPMMEIDSMIMSSFSNNAIICPQLINFNLCFNLDDIMSSTTAKYLKGKALTVSVDVVIDGVEVEKRDFCCNYNFLPRDKYLDETENLPVEKVEQYKNDYPECFTELNVFDHLRDNECLDLVTTNKYCPKICHWCLADNTSYIFNLYRGFDGYGIVIENDKPVFIENEHQYGNVPNTTITKKSNSLNNIGWINYEEIEAWNQFYKYILNTDKYKADKPLHLNGQTFVNGLKYKYVPKDLYILGIKTTSRIFNAIVNTYIDDIDWFNDKHTFGMLVKNDLVLFITLNWDDLTFASVSRLFKNMSKEDGKWYIKPSKDQKIFFRDSYQKILNALYQMVNSVIVPNIVVLNNNICWETVNGPSKSVQEVTYYKDGQIDYVFRYDGRLKPYFIADTDILYYKDYVSDNRENGQSKLQLSKYAQYAHSGFEPIYPSIYYASCKKLENYSRDTLPEVFISEHGYTNLQIDYEYSWFNNSKSVFIIPELKFTYVNKKQADGTYKEVDTIVKELLKEYYNADGDLLDFIVSRYEWKNNWEYFSDTNVDDYIYTINLMMK